MIRTAPIEDGSGCYEICGWDFVNRSGQHEPFRPSVNAEKYEFYEEPMILYMIWLDKVGLDYN